MSDEMTPELFRHLVELAALELKNDEAEYLRHQMNNQLKVIQELVSIPVSPDLPIASHGVPYTASISASARLDELHSYPDPGKLIAQAPETDDGYIIVPEIPHEDLD